MAVDMILDLGGDVAGESKKKGYEGKIEVLGWSWGVSNSGSFHGGTGGGTGQASFQDLSVHKYVDIASPTLMLYCANGKHFDKAKLIVRKAGENPLEYLIIELEKVLVSGYSTSSPTPATSGSSSSDRLEEDVLLNFAQIKLTYWSQNDKGGKDKSKDFGWKIPEGTKL
jgi:type VI secretion system secreted protein Hcp